MTNRAEAFVKHETREAAQRLTMERNLVILAIKQPLMSINEDYQRSVKSGSEFLLPPSSNWVMAVLPFAVVDVFAASPYQGNPLSIVDDTTGVLNKTQMRLISRQFNLSETTFFSRPDDPQADFKLQSFLPNGREVFGAGHNILGVWWYLAQAGWLKFENPSKVYEDGSEEYVFSQELGRETSDVHIIRQKSADGDKFRVSVRQAPPKPHHRHPNDTALAESIGLLTEDIGLKEWASLKPQVMSTSTTKHLIVPVSSVQALNKATVEREKLLQQLVLVDKNAYGLYLFTPDDVHGYQARFFSPGMSAEDPATGSAAGPLARYLYDGGALSLQDGRGKIRLLQGLRIGRHCVIDVVLTAPDYHNLEVDIVGSGVQVMSGTIRIPEETTPFGGQE